MGADQPSATFPGTRQARPAAHPERGDSGQPERQEHRTGGPHGYDGAKRLNGRKRHLLVDALGLICKVHVRAADVGAAQAAGPPPVQPPQQLHGAIAVAHIGGRHVHLDHQAEAVDQQVALAAVDPLGAVVAVEPPVRWS